MTVYVDDLFTAVPRTPRGQYLGDQWCHLMADSDEELHTFAARIGMKREWAQLDARRPWLNHYDLTPTRRTLAIEQGAQELGLEQIVAHIDRRQKLIEWQSD